MTVTLPTLCSNSNPNSSTASTASTTSTLDIPLAPSCILTDVEAYAGLSIAVMKPRIYSSLQLVDGLSEKASQALSILAAKFIGYYKDEDGNLRLKECQKLLEATISLIPFIPEEGIIVEWENRQGKTVCLVLDWMQTIVGFNNPRVIAYFTQLESFQEYVGIQFSYRFQVPPRKNIDAQLLPSIDIDTSESVMFPLESVFMDSEDEDYDYNLYAELGGFSKIDAEFLNTELVETV